MLEVRFATIFVGGLGVYLPLWPAILINGG